MKKPGQIIIWPSDIDTGLTRGQGRKLPVSRAVKDPSLGELSQAARTLGYMAEIVEKAALPRLAWHKKGYLVVKKTSPRQVILKNIAGEIVKLRQKDLQASQQHQHSPTKRK